MIGRRGFLKSIGAAVLGLSLALKLPEKPQQFAVAFDFEALDLFNPSADVYARYIQPAAAALADQWDHRAAEFLING